MQITLIPWTEVDRKGRPAKRKLSASHVPKPWAQCHELDDADRTQLVDYPSVFILDMWDEAAAKGNLPSPSVDDVRTWMIGQAAIHTIIYKGLGWAILGVADPDIAFHFYIRFR